MKIEILGSGCPNCKKTEEIVKKVVKRLGIKVDISHVYDIEKIIERGILTTPAISINGKLKLSGKVPSESEIEKMLKKG